jgi:hypothetical protein
MLLYVHYWRAIKRQLMTLVRPQPDAPEGCPMLLMTGPLLRMIWRIQRDARPQLLELIDSFRGRTRIIHIRSPRELRLFVQRYA